MDCVEIENFEWKFFEPWDKYWIDGELVIKYLFEEPIFPFHKEWHLQQTDLT